MSNANTFQTLLARTRAGDQDAAAELVRQYEPHIRREVRLRLTDPELRRVVDSMDICQSVLGNFFARAALGQFDLAEPRQLLALLVTMARNRVTDWARKQTTQRRDKRRQISIGELKLDDDQELAIEPSASRVAAGRELLRKVREGLSDGERQIADLRAAGSDWAEIAAKLGGTPGALRKRLARALDRVSAELKL